MTKKDRIVRALKREEPDQVPTFEWFIDAKVGKALTGTDDPIDIVERLDLDGINVRADYSKEYTDDRTFVDEWGITRQLTEDCLPALMKGAIGHIDDQADYKFPDPAAPHRFKTLEKALERFGDERAVILNLRDGFSDVRDLLGYEDALASVLTEPELFSELLDRAVEYNLALARLVSEKYGLKVVATTDDVAYVGGMLFPPDRYFDVIGPAFRKAIQGYKELGYYCIKHCDGDVSLLVDFWVECGIDCLDPIDPAAGLRMDEMKEKYGDRICLKGNIDCTGALCDGTEEEVEAEVKECILKGGKGGGLILSSSNTIHSGVKPENYTAMLKALREYGRYPLGA